VQGRDTVDLWRIFFWASIVVAGIVYALIGWSILRYRRRKGDYDSALPPQFREHLVLEVLYTSIPIVIVVALYVVSYRTEMQVLALSSDPDITVHVEAYAWGWRFSYPGGALITSDATDSDPQLVLPQGETTRIVLTSTDVIHAFYVPGFLFKRDAIPGRTQEFDITPNQVGTFQGACAEFCGLNHAFMRFTVRVVTPSEYASWLAELEPTE
jgi:cytochrome c oxidase subunit 2